MSVVEIPSVCEVQLTKGLVTIVDEADYAIVSIKNWHAFVSAGKYAYARSHIANGKPKGTAIFLHRFLLNAKPGECVDHINGNTLDNRRCNLRLCSHAENMRNARPYGRTSKYKGVCWSKANRNWRVQIHTNKKDYHVGVFASEEDAAKAYDEAAIRLHGPFARLNFPADHD